MPPHKLPHEDEIEEVVIHLEPEASHAGDLSDEIAEPEPEMNEWERAGVRPPQRFRH